MKVGIRTPSLKKSISARTTGKVKREIKRSINPYYGKKGMGYVRDPKKAVYNKVYNKTTVGLSDLGKSSKKDEGNRTVGWIMIGAIVLIVFTTCSILL